MAGAGIARNKPNVPEPLTVQTLTVGKNFILSGISAAIALAASQDNWNPAELADNTMLLVNPSADISITGIDSSGLSNGSLVGLRNVHATKVLTIPNQDGQSLGLNQFTTAGLVDMAVNPGDAVIFQYNSTSQKFEVFAFGTQGGGGGGGEVNLGANVGGGTGLIFRDKTGVTLNFKTIIQGANVTITNNADTIQIDATVPAAGTANLTWVFKSAVDATDPASGNYKLNNADRTLATAIYISQDTDPGLDATKLLEALGTDDEIYLQVDDDSTAAALYTVSGAVTDNGTWFTVPVTFVSDGATGFLNNDTCAVIFLYNGGGAGGENNTASNLGVGEADTFKAKAGVDLQFYSLLAGLGTRTRNTTNEAVVDALGANEFPFAAYSYLWDAGTMSRIPEETQQPATSSQTVEKIGPKGDDWSQRGLLDAAAVVMFVTPIGAAPDGPGLDNAMRHEAVMGSECAWQHANIDFQALAAFTVMVGWVRPKLYSSDSGTIRQWLMRQGDSGANNNMLSVEAVNIYNSPGNQASSIEAIVDLNTGRQTLTYALPDPRAWYHVELRVSLALIELLVNNVVVDSAAPAAASYTINNTPGVWLEWFGSVLGTGGQQLNGNYGRYHGIAEHYLTDAESIESFNYRDGPTVEKNGAVILWWYNGTTTTDKLGASQREYRCSLNSGPLDVMKFTTAFANIGFAGDYQCEFYFQNNGADPIGDLIVGAANDKASELVWPGLTADSAGLLVSTGQLFVNNAVVATLAGGAILKGETVVFYAELQAGGNVTETFERYDASLVLLDSISNVRAAFSGVNAERYTPVVGRTQNAISDTIECRFAPRDLSIPFREGFSAWTTSGEGQGIVPAARAFKTSLAIAVQLSVAQAVAIGPAVPVLFDVELHGTFPRGSLDPLTGEVTIPGSVRRGIFKISAEVAIGLDDQEFSIMTIMVIRTITLGGNLSTGGGINTCSAVGVQTISVVGAGQPVDLNGGDKIAVLVQHNGGVPRNVSAGVSTQLMLEQID